MVDHIAPPTPDSLVSVVMPMFNAERHLAETIESVLNQTHENLEFVIIDDGSTDKSAEIVQRFVETDPRIRLFQQENKGVDAASNRALELAKSDWVFRLDADDVMFPHRLEKQISFIQAHPDAQVVSCIARYIDDKGREFGNSVNSIKSAEHLKDLLQRGETIGLIHPGSAMRKDTVLSIGGYRKMFGAAGDIDLWNRLAELGHLILVQDEVLVKYRIHDGSMTTADYLRSRKQYEWVRECIRHRRSGKPEPTWEEFLAIWKSAPLWVKIGRSRKIYAKYMYRSAGRDFVERKRLNGALKYFVSVVFQPSYAVPRAIEQVGKRLGR